MPYKRFDQARPFAVLAGIVIAWVVLPLGAKLFLRASFFEFEAPLDHAAGRVRDLQEYWALRMHSKADLIQAGRDIGHLAASYENTVHENEALREEVGRLEGILRIPALPGYRSEHARVIRRDFSGWWQQLVIRKGRTAGITVGSPVIFAGGVVGRVTEVHLLHSVVEMLSSQGLRIAAVFEGDDRPVSFQGGVNPAFGPARGEIEFVPLDLRATAERPRTLVTSGLGGVFPAGLVVGQVTKLAPEGDGLFQVGEVRLDPRLASLSEVTVLVPEVVP